MHAEATAIKNSGGYPDDTEMQVMARIKRVVNDKSCVPFWRAISRRHKAIDEHGHGYESDSTDGRLVIVLYEIGEAALGIQAQNKLTATERKRKGKAIAHAAAQLRKALDAISVDECFPGWFYDGLEQPGSDDEDGASDDYRTGKDAALYCYKETTLAFERAGRALAASKPDVPQSRSKTADKTRFIRFATATMRQHYKTPLREAVASLTRSLYACEADVSMVAKIAP